MRVSDSRLGYLSGSNRLPDLGRSVSRDAQKLWTGDFVRHAVYLPHKQLGRAGAPTPPVGRRDTAMHRVHQEQQGREQQLLDLDEIARQGARRMLAEALEAEVEAYIQAANDQRDEDGRALVVRNGTPGSGRSSWEPARWRSRLPGSTIVGWIKPASAGGSRA
jgi:hypothetical protein